MMRILLLLLLSILTCLAQPAGHDLVNASRWKSATIAKHRVHEVEVIAKRIEKNIERYKKVSGETKVPWEIISGLHNMESGGSFNHHLHEGSSLKGRTKYVPKGRPLTGTPPFAWEYSAKDALLYDKMDKKNWKEVGSALSSVEKFNGDGYRKYHPETPSPYLWAGTSIEKAGKYIRDGVWSPTARSKQIGIAAIWKKLNAYKD
jgi:lysozyme family protein